MSTLLHPNGYIQHDLLNGSRLHIWASGLPQAQKTRSPIHDHTFRFVSTIVMGALVHETYEVTPLNENTQENAALWTHNVYVGDGNGLLRNANQAVRVTQRDFEVYGLGVSYSYGGAGNFHDAYGAEGEFTVTIMRKTANNLGEAPQVLVPRGVLPDNTFRRDQYPEAVLAPWVRKALHNINPRFNHLLYE